MEVCGSILTVEDSVKIINSVSMSVAMAALRVGECRMNGEKSLTSVFEEVDRFVTIVRTKEMLVRPMHNDTSKNTSDAAGKEFLRRRTHIAGMGVLAIVAGIVLAARAVIGLAVNNDMNDGIERMIKERVGLEYCDSPVSERAEDTLLLYDTEQFDWTVV